MAYDYLCGVGDSPAAVLLREACGSPRKTLELLAARGVSAVEIRQFDAAVPARLIVAAARLVWEAGLVATLHPATPASYSLPSLGDVFPWLPELARGLPPHQSQLLLTIHARAAAAGDVAELRRGTEAMFSRLAHMADSEGLPAVFALELNRSKGESDPSTSFRGVVEMCKAIGQPRVGICWDWGHAQANQESGVADGAPPAEFIQQVIHTHVHDLGPDGSTHWPLGRGSVPLERNAELLSRAGFRGLYCLELNPERFQLQARVDTALRDSLQRLEAALAVHEP